MPSVRWCHGSHFSLHLPSEHRIERVLCQPDASEVFQVGDAISASVWPPGPARVVMKHDWNFPLLPAAPHVAPFSERVRTLSSLSGDQPRNDNLESCV